MQVFDWMTHFIPHFVFFVSSFTSLDHAFDVLAIFCIGLALVLSFMLIIRLTLTLVKFINLGDEIVDFVSLDLKSEIICDISLYATFSSLLSFDSFVLSSI